MNYMKWSSKEPDKNIIGKIGTLGFKYIEIPVYVKGVLNTLNENGYAAYIVGGCVRDSLLGVEPKDWDVTTEATPDQVEYIFEHTIPTGKQYGTITVICEDGEQVEITTFRKDAYYI